VSHITKKITTRRYRLNVTDKMIILIYDHESGESDTKSQETAMEDIKEFIRSPGSCSYRFGNSIYQNEWRIALKQRRIMGFALFSLFNLKDGTLDVQEFDQDGKADHWPDQMSVWDHQLDQLI